MSLRFLGPWHPLLGILLAATLAILAWRLYRKETRDNVPAPFHWLLPTLRSVAIALIVLTLTEPTLETKVRIGEPGKIIFAVDGSHSMSLSDDLSDVDLDGNAADATGRFSRALGALTQPEQGLITQLADRFDMSVERIDSQGQTTLLWDSRFSPQPSQEIPDGLPAEASMSTALGDGLATLAQSLTSENLNAQSVIVVLTDGQNNSGRSPIATAEALAARQIPVFTVGFGVLEGSADLSIVAGNIPQRVYLEDTLTGTMTISERIDAGTAYSAEILFQDKVMWQTELESNRLANREIPFSIAVSEIVQAALQENTRQVEFAALPVKLEFRVRTESESYLSNNQISAFTTVTTQKAKVLLIDGRSRWETRYLKNLYSRDPAWDLSAVIAHPSSLYIEASQTLPKTKEDWFEYNLIILGDVPASLVGPERLAWLRDFVALRGGGLIMIDGARGELRSQDYEVLRDLIPIDWTSMNSRLLTQPWLTQDGTLVDALRLTESHDPQQDWQQLEPLQYVSQVKARIGSEVLAVAQSPIDETPLMVYRQFGAGKVLFMASDETWRWRYKVADQIHTRLWNQLSRWIMRSPLAVRGEFVSLDSGRPNYEPGQAIEVKCQLRGADGQPLSGQTASAVLNSGSEIVTRIPLVESRDIPGSYSMVVESLPPGDYRIHIEAAGFPQDVLNVESMFSVIEPVGEEFKRITCNEALLQNIATTTGASYVYEDQIHSLADILSPLSGGRIQTSMTLLWQSYWWFCIALALLAIEWVLRKRVGLI